MNAPAQCTPCAMDKHTYPPAVISCSAYSAGHGHCPRLFRPKAACWAPCHLGSQAAQMNYSKGTGQGFALFATGAYARGACDSLNHVA